MFKFSCNLIGSQTEKKVLKAFTALPEFDSIEIEYRSLEHLRTQKSGAIIGCEGWEALQGILKHLKSQGIECRGVYEVEEDVTVPAAMSPETSA